MATQFIIRYRWLIVAVSLVTCMGLGVLIPTAETDPEIRNYIPSSMPSRMCTDSIEQAFGVQDMIIVLFTDSCILDPSDLREVKSVDRAFSRMEGIATVNSPFTARKIKSDQGMMIVDPLVKSIPQNQEERESLRRDILDNRFARDVVFSSDMTGAAVTGTLSNSEPEHVILAGVDSLISSLQGKASVLTGGLPYIRRYILRDVLKDAIILIPLALVIMLTILKISLGEWRSVIMPFSVVLLATAATMGLIPLLGWKISILTLLVPIILISVANNYGIYLVSREKEVRRINPGIGGTELVRAVTGSLNMPILFSGLTTIAGILGLLAHSVIPARQVGVLSAVGVTLALAMSLLFIPAVLIIRRSGGRVKTKVTDKKPDLLARLAASAGSLVTQHPARVLVAALTVTLLIGLGSLLVRIDTNQENYFPPSHPVRKASAIINSKFGGSQTVSVMVSGNIKDPEVMTGIDSLTRMIRAQEGVGTVFSISDVVREMSMALYEPGEEGYDRIPGSEEAISQMFEIYNMSGSPDDFSQLMNFENTRAHILVRLSRPDNDVIKLLREKIVAFAPAIPAKLTVGGYAAIMADFAARIIQGQVSSLIFALLTVFILLSIIFRSLRGGLVGSIPLAASIIIQFGVMGLAGLPLDAATALLSSIMVGVGVDFTIQYLWRLNIELRSGLPYAEATVKTLTTTGRSIFINAFSVMAGFSATFFSGFLSIRFFGYLVILSIGSCLLYAIIVIPAFMLRFRPRFIEADLESPLFKKKRYENEKVNAAGPVDYTGAGHYGPAAGPRSANGEEP